MKVAEGCAKKGLDTGKRGVADAVIADLRVSSDVESRPRGTAIEKRRLMR